jgi:hypothetical protein
MASTLKLANAHVTSRPARAATDPNGPTGRLATWLANTTVDDIPPFRARARQTPVARRRSLRFGWRSTSCISKRG